MNLLRIIIACIFILHFTRLSACEISSVDSLEAQEAIELLNSCEPIENVYLHSIKLGDSYFRNRNWAMAILNYERARKLNSSDDKLVKNLINAYSHTNNGAKTLLISEISSAKHMLTSPHLRDYWVVINLLFLLSSVLLYMKRSSDKSSRASKILTGTIIIALVFMGLALYSFSQEKNYAVVMDDSVPVYGSTSGTTDPISVLNLGYRLEVSSMKEDWAEVILATNQRAWLHTSSIELVGN